MHHLAIFLFLFFTLLPFDAAGFSNECWHCFSEKHGNCENPYNGRYGPNSTILKPDCSHDMALAYHATVIYVLSTTSRITEIGSNDTSQWSELGLAPGNFDCCKSELDVVTFDGAQKSFVVRGCCHAPSIHDQCEEVENLCREMTQTLNGPNGTINRSTCKVTHCSACEVNNCNSANIIAESASSLMLTATIILLKGLVGFHGHLLNLKK